MRFKSIGARACALLTLIIPGQAGAQTAGPSGRDTTLAANPDFQAGSFHRTLLGDNWRDEWSTRITVPFLDLRTFAGGLTPTETGGGYQTVNLRMTGKNGIKYVFRPVDKGISLPDLYRRTIIWKFVSDVRSSLYPIAPLVGVPLLEAAGIPHPTPRLFVMPDDPLLGEFRQQFAGLMGTIEVRSAAEGSLRAFPGASDIVNAEDFLERINKSPENTVDARVYLAARLVDMLLNDNDRHPGNWDWARFGSGTPWVPVPKDRDKVIHSEEGLLPALAGLAATKITPFEAKYPSLPALVTQAMEMDRRLLGNLDRPVWDSVASALTARITDDVIDASVNSLPSEYSFSFAELSSKLKARRNGIPALAKNYYALINEYADIHASDADEQAAVFRSGDGIVDVYIQAVNRAPYFRRRYYAGETKEIRLYLHGGNDAAIVRGDVRSSIPVRIIGGDGTNNLIDSSRVAGRRNPTRLYDVGTVRGTRYDADSADKRKFSEDVMPFNRRPWSLAYGELAPAQKDRGTSIQPVGSIGSGHGLGVVPTIGIARYTYGFRKVPYASMTSAEVAYSTAIRGFDVKLAYDKRFESSSFHLPVEARMSQLEVVEFRGFGNDVPDFTGAFDEVKQRAWTFRPALGFSPNSESDISLGPVLRYTNTDSVANRFISQQRPYGFDPFGQAGLQLQLRYDTRGSQGLWDVGGRNVLVQLAERDPTPVVWGKMDLEASAYPAIMDVGSAYQKVAGTLSVQLTAPFLTRPQLALRGGGEKLYGDFPYFDAAFIGGSRSLRTEHRQRFAGDASLYGTTELRIPIGTFPVLVPLNVGLIGFVDVARVYVDGESPGGWHQGTGAGFWLGFVRPNLSISFMRTNNPDRPLLTTLGFAF